MAMRTAQGISEAKGKNTEIRKRHLILCEGKDELFFLIAYLNSADLSGTLGFSEYIQVLDFGGNDDLPKYLAALKVASGFDRVKTLLIVRDAEKDASLAMQQIKGALKNNGFAVPDRSHQWVRDEKNNGINIGFLLFPSCDEAPVAGTLEDLCLSVLNRPDAPELLEAVDGFLGQIERERGRGFSRKFKTRLHTYFAVSDDYVGMKIGEAAHAGAFGWSNEKLAPLREFIRKKMCEDSTE